MKNNRETGFGAVFTVFFVFSCALGLIIGPSAFAQEEAEFPSAESGENLAPPTDEPPAPLEPIGPDLTQANELITAQEWQQADDLLAAILVEWPEDVGTLLMRGEVLLALQKPADARPLLEKVVELAPDHPRANFQLAAVLQSAGESEAALEHFAREIELNEAPEVRIMAHTNRSIIFEQEEKWAEAAAEMEAVVAIDPDDPRYYGDLASLYLQAEDLPKVADALARGSEAGFASYQHYYILGSRYYRQEEFELAAGAFEQALELNPNYPAVEKSLGGTMEKLGRNADAAAHFERYLELAPDAADAKGMKKHIKKLQKG
jgi:tetratricopeptide (TPR) repeat protein